VGFTLTLLLLFAPAACSAGSEPARPPGPSSASDDARLTIEITSSTASAPTGIRAAIEQANATVGPTRIVSRLAPGTEIYIVRALPNLKGADTIFDAEGLVLRSGSCTRSDAREGCDGLVVSGPKIRVNGLVARDFLFDGIAVRGASAVDVRISDCRCFGNRDDGVGVSAYATSVVVERCVLEGNGYRTKGKGILVFDYAEAELRDNVVRGNRDGITISRRSRAHLVGNKIIGNYDKGFGVAGAYATGERNTIESNGLGMEGLDTPPNADGIRVTIDSTLRLSDTSIAGNGDSGIVVIGTGRATLTGGRIVGNAGVGVRGADNASIRLEGVTVRENRGGAESLEDLARLEKE
jgi:parallel beta-helix repeat protein